MYVCLESCPDAPRRVLDDQPWKSSYNLQMHAGPGILDIA